MLVFETPSSLVWTLVGLVRVHNETNLVVTNVLSVY